MSAQPRWEPSAASSRAGLSVAPGGRTSDVDARVLASAAFASLAVAAIHVAAAVAEADAGTTTVLFFAGVALAQAVWGSVALVRANRAWLVLGAIGNLAVALVWAWSRTVGLPVGPYAGVVLPPAFPDVVATVLEVGIACGATTLALRGGRVDRAAPRAPAFTAVAGVVLAALGLVAVLAQLGAIEGLAGGS